MRISKLTFMRVRGESERLIVIISDPQKEKDGAMLAARRRGEKRMKMGKGIFRRERTRCTNLMMSLGAEKKCSSH
jgi:hypothetical protein